MSVDSPLSSTAALPWPPWGPYGGGVPQSHSIPSSPCQAPHHHSLLPPPITLCVLRGHVQNLHISGPEWPSPYLQPGLLSLLCRQKAWDRKTKGILWSMWIWDKRTSCCKLPFLLAGSSCRSFQPHPVPEPAKSP